MYTVQLILEILAFEDSNSTWLLTEMLSLDVRAELEGAGYTFAPSLYSPILTRISKEPIQ